MKKQNENKEEEKEKDVDFVQRNFQEIEESGWIEDNKNNGRSLIRRIYQDENGLERQYFVNRETGEIVEKNEDDYVIEEEVVNYLRKGDSKWMTQRKVSGYLSQMMKEFERENICESSKIGEQFGEN